MAVVFRKPEFIRKFDYLRSFYRPHNHWFWPAPLIDSKINHLISNQYKKNASIDYSDENESGYDSENAAADILDQHREYIGDYLLLKDKYQADFVLNDAKTIEWKIILQTAQETILKQYSSLKCLNLSLPEYEYKSSKEKEKLTLDFLKQNKTCLIFNATFIAKQKAIAVCDAVIVIDRTIFIVEIKVSTKLKSSSIASAYYQRKILEEFLKTHNFDYEIKHLFYHVERCLAKKNQVSFVSFEEFAHQKDGLPFHEKESITFSMDEILNEELLAKSDKKITKSIKEKIKMFKENFNDNTFWATIDKLWDFEIQEDFNFKPDIKFLSFFKDNDNLKSIREFYRCSNKYNFMGFSGFILNMKSSIELLNAYQQDKLTLQEQIKIMYKSQDNPNATLSGFNTAIRHFNEYPKYYIDDSIIKHFKEHIKPKKVYFDFESINLAVRPMDDIYPYLQVVNQVSIITDHNDKTPVNQLISRNIIIDPIDITNGSFKLIIDSILEWVDNPKEYSFIIYNQSFEQTALKRMAEIINEPEYYQKVLSITENMADIANYFDVRKSCCIYIWELKGFYSIKYVLDYIKNESPHIFNITGCKNYKELEIQNGLVAQQKSTLRFFKKINDDDWKTISNQLKIYCENDVRAMIAVEYWIKEKIKEYEKNK